MWAEKRVRTGDYDWYDIFNAELGESCIIDYERKISIAIKSIKEKSPSPCYQENEVCDKVEKKSVRQLLEENNKLLNDIVMCLKKLIDIAQ